ncbi:LuxR C-terminal-related transcriptional regulator [Microbacterium esteraromaticum]|uniref:LuxR C-terminal-related transcriptional regulator n=1 Tax=Microbacterium esteraromaticum TaxID=57043 RepID=UPI001C946A5A|nr:LuxR C-terminal-related transcriptional regulator [Microbacterium esteraromaticum]MBY6061713.1 LuxR C-terminal-related transcriptional regulator [Microbacterium esteraromaticum]
MSTIARCEPVEQLVAEGVRELARCTRFPVAFGGLIDHGTVSVTNIIGNRTRSLDGLNVRPERGLGGRAMIELRPRMTNDYRTSRQITHDYDVYVLGEGLRTLLALPIIVDGRPRGVLYAGAWEESQIGGVTTAPAMGVVQRIGTELRVRDEVERRVREMAPAPVLDATQREDLRESFAELRSIAALLTDDALRGRIASVERRLLGLAAPQAEPVTEPVQTVHLSRRELDVLSCAAMGSTNAQIAAQLTLREGTVKAYLGAAMSKLDASTRHAAVTRARRLGLLP